MADPETVQAKVQADPLAQAIAEAREEMLARPDAPEATPAPGTGPEATKPPEPTGEVDWSDADARDAYLKEKFLPKDEHENRLKNQLRSLQDKLDLADQAERRQRHEAMLAELDRLAENEPEEFAERVRKDTAAASALAERAAAIPPTVMNTARMQMAMDQSRVLFTVVPELEAVAQEGGDRWREVVNPETGGVFGYLHRSALDEGRRVGVEDFKKSKEYKDALQAAEQRGVRNSLGEFAVGTPAPEGATPIGTETPAQKFSDPVKQAAHDAARELGRTVDMGRIGSVRSGAR